jgi:DNA invertase Pin-like site-specific DNA recombinase
LAGDRSLAKIAYSYVRFSTKKQELGDSLRRQVDQARAYCERHGLTLDETLKVDVGVSGFKTLANADGKQSGLDGLNIKKGALGYFLKLIETGIVKKGAILLIENFDRLSRQPPLDALDIFKAIINAGVKIVTLSDGQEYTRESVNSQSGQIYVLLGTLQRAHSESQIKSQRIEAVWSQRHKSDKARKGRCPSWIIWDEKKESFALDPAKKKIVQRMVQLAIEGVGSSTICQKFNAEKLPTLSKRDMPWDDSTIRHILKSRTLIGEYQPCKMSKVGRKQIPTGEPKKIYPAVIDVKTFHQLQGALSKRRSNVRGRRGPTVANLFGSLLKSGKDGSTMVFVQKRQKNVLLQSADYLRGLSKEGDNFPYRAFEGAFLRWIPEIELRSAQSVDNVEALEGELSDLHGRIAKLEAKLATALPDSAFDRLLGMLEKFNARELALKGQIEAEQATRHASKVSIKDVSQIVKEMAKASGPALVEIRTRLRAAIYHVVSEIKLYIYYVDRFSRLAMVHVRFPDGSDRVITIETRKGEIIRHQSDGFRQVADGEWAAQALTDEQFRHIADRAFGIVSKKGKGKLSEMLGNNRARPK